MVSMGFHELGYEYVNIDDCWQIKDHRDNVTGKLIPDTSKFSDGISGLADTVHGMGMKIGIYSSAGTLTCAGYEASIEHEEIDASTFAEWGIDFLKYDNCNVPSNWTDECSACTPDSSDSTQYVNGTCKDTTGQCPDGYDYSQSLTFERYARMRDALAKQNRTILYNLCEWGTAKVWTWGAEVAQAWRSTGDIDRE